MNLIKKVIFSTPTIKPNLFIGGVGGAWSTKAILATQIGVPLDSIKYYKNKDSNIEANITSIATQINIGHVYPITYIIDEGSIFVDCLVSFRLSTTIKRVVLPYARNTTGALFLSATNIEEIIMPNMISRTSGLGGFAGLYSIKTLDIRRFTMETATQNNALYFQDINTSCVIKINVTNKTSNNGNPANGLVVAKNLGCTIEFYENGIYHSTL